MYKCQDCQKEFKFPRKTKETHSLPFGPYEEIRLCPFCASHLIIELPEHYCRYCGAKVKAGQDYCSSACRKKGEAAYKRQEENKIWLHNNPVSQILREVAEYNKKNGKNLSYGEYVSGRR